MKTLRLIGMTIMMVLIAGSFTACGSDNDEEEDKASTEMKKFVGTWILTEFREEHSDNPYMSEWSPYGTFGDYYLIIKPDYTYEFQYFNLETGKFRVDAYGGLYFNDKLAYFYKWIDSNTLDFQKGYSHYKFVRK